MNREIISLLLTFNPIRWRNLSKKLGNIPVKDSFVPQDIYNVVSFYLTDTDWLCSNLSELNGYRPFELACCFKGRMILKSYLLKKVSE